MAMKDPEGGQEGQADVSHQVDLYPTHLIDGHGTGGGSGDGG